MLLSFFLFLLIDFIIVNFSVVLVLLLLSDVAIGLFPPSPHFQVSFLFFLFSFYPFSLLQISEFLFPPGIRLFWKKRLTLDLTLYLHYTLLFNQYWPLQDSVNSWRLRQLWSTLLTSLVVIIWIFSFFLSFFLLFIIKY